MPLQPVAPVASGRTNACDEGATSSYDKFRTILEDSQFSGELAYDGRETMHNFAFAPGNFVVVIELFGGVAPLNFALKQVSGIKPLAHIYVDSNTDAQSVARLHDVDPFFLDKFVDYNGEQRFNLVKALFVPIGPSNPSCR